MSMDVNMTFDDPDAGDPKPQRCVARARKPNDGGGGTNPVDRRRERSDAVLAAKMRSGGKSVPPPPLFLQKPGRKPRTREDVSRDRDRRQLPPRQRIRARSRAPSGIYRSREFQVRLPPPPPPLTRVTAGSAE